jgi:hypothetical protein
MVGVVLSVVMTVLAVRAVVGTYDCVTNEFCGSGILLSALAYFVVIPVGLFATGIVVAISSRDSWLAVRAIPIGVAVLALVALIVVGTIGRPSGLDARKFIDDLIASGFVAVVLLIPTWIGFGVGRLIQGRRSRNDSR